MRLLYSGIQRFFRDINFFFFFKQANVVAFLQVSQLKKFSNSCSLIQFFFSLVSVVEFNISIPVKGEAWAVENYNILL